MRYVLLSFIALGAVTFSGVDVVSALVTPSTSPVSISNGLVGYWTFDGKYMTSSTSTDSSGSGNHGTITNSPTLVLGKTGQALNFTAANSQYVTIADNDILDVTSHDMSFAAWIKPTNTNQISSFLSKRLNTGNVDQWTMWINDGTISYGAGKKIGIAFGNIAGSNLNDIATTANIVDGNWHHIVGVIKYNNTLEIYVDGVLAPTTTIRSQSWTSINTSMPVLVGSDNGGHYFDGAVDDVRIYNRALTAQEVAILAGVKGKPVTTSNNGLIGYWPFDANTVESTVLKDKSGRGNNASLVASPAKVQGKVRDAYSFDGSTQYAQVTASSDLNLTSNATLAAWVKVSTLKNYNQVVMRNRANIDFYGMVIDSTGGVFAQFANNSSVCAPLSTTKIEAGRWYHLVVTYDGSLGSANCKIYINAVQDATTATYSGGIGTGFTTEVLAIGMDPANASRVFSGSIDEVKVYNRTLSPSEITTLYKSGATTGSYGAIATSSILISSGLVSYLTFDGKTMTSSTSTDSSGAGNHGALNNSPRVVLGKVGQGVSLNGSNQYINAGRNTSLNFTGNMAIAFWINPNASQVSLANVINKHGSGNAGFTLQQNSASTNAYAFAWGNGSGYTCDSTTLFTATANMWQHVVVSKSGAVLTAYLNGVQSGTCTGSFSTIATNSDNVNIGRWTSGAARYWGGSLDDMRLYNRALSVSEVKTLYAMGAK